MTIRGIGARPEKGCQDLWAELTARRRCCAHPMSLNAIAIPAAREPSPLVTRCRSRTVAKVDAVGLPGAQVDPVLTGEVVGERPTR